MSVSAKSNSRPTGKIYSFGEGRPARLYDTAKANNVACQEVAMTALSECKDREVDGIIVIVAKKNGKKAKTYTAGSLAEHDNAAFEAFRLQIAMALARARE